jgi:outer membrane biogenesis lipoprotein LolB
MISSAPPQGTIHSKCWIWVTGGILLMMLGCATPADPGKRGASSSLEEEFLSRVPLEFSPWTAFGKLAVQFEGSTETARFEWHRAAPDHDNVTFSGPFSINQQKFERVGSALSWRDGDTNRPISELAKASAAATLLAALPPDTLARWLLGYTADARGWEAEVRKWHQEPPWKLPEKILIQGDNIAIQLVVSQWRLSNSP